MVAGDKIKVMWTPKGRAVVEERYTLRNITSISIVVEPEPGRMLGKRIPWDMVLKVGREAL